MLRRVLFAFSTIASFTSASTADVLHPLEKWVVDYREDQCIATRAYGPAENPITIGIRPAPNGETYELLVSRKHAGPNFATEEKGYVDFGQGRIRSWLLNYGFKQTKRDVYQFRISTAEMQQARAATAVQLNASTQTFTFELGPMGALLKTLEDCTADLKHYWNMDAEQQTMIATPSKGDIRAVFTSGDYPSEAYLRGQSGDSQFLLLIDEKGNVAACHVLRPSGVPVLDAMGCQVLLKRAKFIPAHDAGGKPVRSSVVTPKVSWRME